MTQTEDQFRAAHPEAQDVDAPLDERMGLINLVQKQQAQLSEEVWLDLAIPGYKNLLWARFRPHGVDVTERKLDGLRKQATGKQPILLRSACLTLTDACEQLMLLPQRFDGDIGKDGENLIVIDEEAVPPIGFDTRAARLFAPQVEHVQTNQQVIKALFPTEQAIINLARQVTEWLNDTTREQDEILLGE